MKILLLGGTQEGKQLAERLVNYHQIELIYSTVRKVPPPTTNYTAIHGGFGGAENLAKKLGEEHFDLLLDVTYPYAAQMSKNAAIAATLSSTPIWSYQQPRWTATPNDRWHFYDSLSEIISAIQPYQRCFFSLGNSFPDDEQTVPNHQQWFIRYHSANKQKKTANKTFVEGGGPFSYKEALKLFKSLKIDALISNACGGGAAKAKIEAARAASIPVFFISRPLAQSADRQFTNISSIEQALIQDYCLKVA
jgi:precorrin-6A/cobalt-precorrin-6A reductase